MPQIHPIRALHFEIGKYPPSGRCFRYWVVGNSCPVVLRPIWCLYDAYKMPIWCLYDAYMSLCLGGMGHLKSYSSGPHLAPLWRCWLFIEVQQLEFNGFHALSSPTNGQRSPWDDQLMLSPWFGSPLWKGLLLSSTPIRTPTPPWPQNQPRKPVETTTFSRNHKDIPSLQLYHWNHWNHFQSFGCFQKYPKMDGL